MTDNSTQTGQDGVYTATEPEVEDVLEALRDVVDPELGVNVVDLGLVRAAVFERELNTRDEIARDLDLVLPHALLEFLGHLAGPLLVSLLLADTLILHGAPLDVLHERGRCRPAMDLVRHIGIQTVAARRDKDRTDHQNPGAPLFLGVCPKCRPAHGTPPLYSFAGD